MRTLFKICTFLALVLPLNACFDINQGTENLSLDKDFNMVEINNEYKIAVPKYMKEAKDLNDEASLQYQNIFKETYIVIIDEPKDEFVSIFKELEEYDTTISAVKNYCDVQTQYITESVEAMKKSDPVSLKINGLNAEMYEMEGTIENIGVYYNLTFVEGIDKLYMIMAWTLKTRKEKYKATFKTAISSFSLIE